LTSSVLTALRSGAVTTTVSEHEVLAPGVSMITPAGSTAHTPPEGFTNDPTTSGVAINDTSNAPVEDPITTEPPDAMHDRTAATTRLLEMIEHASVPEPEIRTVPDTLTAPYEISVLGRLSDSTVCPLANVASPVPVFAT
jgi:hypothetical protein